MPLLIAGAIFLLSGQPAHALSANLLQLLQKIQESAGIPYKGEMTVQEGGRPAVRLEVQHSAANALRYRYLDPASMAGELIVDNRTISWHYSPWRRRIEVRPSEGGAILPDLALLIRNYQVLASPAEAIAGRPTIRLKLRPRQTYYQGRELWVDSETGVPLRVTVRDWHDQSLRSSEFRSIDYKVALNPQDFQLTMPPGIRVTSHSVLLARSTDLQYLARISDLPIPRPAALPPGYMMKEGRIFQTEAGRMLHISYTDGLNVLSLFLDPGKQNLPPDTQAIQLSLPKGPAILMNQSLNRLLCWQSQGVQFTLIGGLGASELIHFADELELQQP